MALRTRSVTLPEDQDTWLVETVENDDRLRNVSHLITEIIDSYKEFQDEHDNKIT